jgi:hypothetical protein
MQRLYACSPSCAALTPPLYPLILNHTSDWSTGVRYWLIPILYKYIGHLFHLFPARRQFHLVNFSVRPLMSHVDRAHVATPRVSKVIVADISSVGGYIVIIAIVQLRQRGTYLD